MEGLRLVEPGVLLWQRFVKTKQSIGKVSLKMNMQ